MFGLLMGTLQRFKDDEQKKKQQVHNTVLRFNMYALFNVHVCVRACMYACACMCVSERARVRACMRLTLQYK